MSLRAADTDKCWRICFTYDRHSINDEVCPFKYDPAVLVPGCAVLQLLADVCFEHPLARWYITSFVEINSCIWCYRNQCFAPEINPQPLSHKAPQWFFFLCPRWTGTGSKLPVGATARVSGCASLSGALINCLWCAPAWRKSAGISSSACGPLKDKQV